jgi:hypothetical protein
MSNESPGRPSTIRSRKFGPNTPRTVDKLFNLLGSIIKRALVTWPRRAASSICMGDSLLENRPRSHSHRNPLKEYKCTSSGDKLALRKFTRSNLAMLIV